MRKHLFIAITNHSGSTLMQAMIATSKNAVNLDDDATVEGQALIPGCSPTIGKYYARWFRIADELLDANLYDWKRIKEIWGARWQWQLEGRNPTMPVFVEKSPPNVMRARFLRKEFPRSCFIFGVRDPYAFCESVKRAISINNIKDPIKEAIQHWVYTSRRQMGNAKMYDALLFRYEDIIHKTQMVKEKIVAMRPELEDMTWKAEFKIKGKTRPIVDCNPEQIARLSEEEISIISDYLKNHQDVIDHFEYTIKD